jgi:phi13 family phage major tail protein
MSTPSIGLKNLVYAILTTTDDGQTVPQYSAVKPILGAISAKITNKVTTDVQYFDDAAGDVIQTIGVVDVELNVRDLSLSVQADLLGHTYSNGLIVKKKTDAAPFVAIGFKALKSDKKHYRYIWLLKGMFQPVDSDAETMTDKVKVQNPTIKGTFLDRLYDGEYQRICEDDDPNYSPAIGSNWFNYVDNPADTTPPTLLSSVPVAGATGVADNSNIVLTFSEPILNVNANNFMLLKASNGEPVTVSVSQDTTGKIITITPQAPLEAATQYISVVSTAVTDINKNALIAPVIVNFTSA